MITIITTFHKNYEDVDKVYNNFKKSIFYNSIAEYYFINDNYPDETWERIKILCSKEKKLKGLCFTKNFGQLSGIQAGIFSAKGEKILYHDSDILLNDDFIRKCCDSIDEKNNITWARPNIKNNFFRTIFKYLYKIITKKDYNFRSIFMISKRIKDKILSEYEDGNFIIGEILTNLNEKQNYIDIIINHNYSKTRYNIFDKFLLALKHFNAYIEKIYLKIILFSFFVSIISVLSLVIFFVIKLFSSTQFLPGWLSTVFLIIVFNSFLIFLISLGFLLNLQTIKIHNKKGNYLIKEILNS